jgi:tetratricopeptide (TPR) repeat protein
VSEEDRRLGLALFEAEETLARGAPDKALVQASKIVKEHPESLTARALLDRARRELLRGRRRERLETRVREAQGFFEAGDFAGAERIVTSALKLLPDHALALDLFAKLRERRLQAGTAEAEAERELLALARTQAKQAAQAARTALAAGWGRRAVLALRRGLRLVPDDPALLELLREAQRSLETLDAGRSRRHAEIAQVRAGLDLLAHGQLDESLRILRAVLREDPDNQRAQAAIQEVRRVFLARGKDAAGVTPATASPNPAPRPAPVLTPRPPPIEEEPPVAPATILRQATPPIRRPPAADIRQTSAPRAERAIPPEIMLPRTRRRATPLGVVIGAGILLCAVVLLLAGRSGSPPQRRVPPSTSAPMPPQSEPATAATPHETLPGPLTSLDPELRQAIETTLTAYARALEKADAARPDMSSVERDARLSAFAGALNAATDIRVLDASVREDKAVVAILSTDVIVGGSGRPSPPLEETLRFERRGRVWALGSARGRR